MNKITDIWDEKPKKTLTVEEAAKRAYRERFRNTPVEEEPKGLASGKADPDGRMRMDDGEE